MAFERNLYGFDGEFSFICDCCGEEDHTETSDFHAAIRHVKQHGWVVSKDADNDWVHFCSPACASENGTAESDFG